MSKKEEAMALPAPKIEGDEEAKLIQVRRDAALGKEQQAWSDRVDVRKWELMLEHYKTLYPTATAELVSARKRAETSRDEADAMHKKAGTTQVAFKDLILSVLASVRGGFEGQYLRAVDAESDKKAYSAADRSIPKELYTCGIAAVDELVLEAAKL